MEIIKHSKETDILICSLDKLRECEELTKIIANKWFEPEQVAEELTELESTCNKLRSYIREILIWNMYNNIKHGIELA